MASMRKTGAKLPHYDVFAESYADAAARTRKGKVLYRSNVVQRRSSDGAFLFYVSAYAFEQKVTPVAEFHADNTVHIMVPPSSVWRQNTVCWINRRMLGFVKYMNKHHALYIPHNALAWSGSDVRVDTFPDLHKGLLIASKHPQYSSQVANEVAEALSVGTFNAVYKVFHRIRAGIQTQTPHYYEARELWSKSPLGVWSDSARSVYEAANRDYFRKRAAVIGWHTAWSAARYSPTVLLRIDQATGQAIGGVPLSVLSEIKPAVGQLPVDYAQTLRRMVKALQATEAMQAHPIFQQIYAKTYPSYYLYPLDASGASRLADALMLRHDGYLVANLAEFVRPDGARRSVAGHASSTAIANSVARAIRGDGIVLLVEELRKRGVI